MSLSDLRVCVDRPIPPGRLMMASRLAVSENPRNKPAHVFTQSFGRPPEPEQIAIFTSQMWRNSRTLRVSFQGGDNKVKTRVRDFANEWMKFLNLKLVWVYSTSPAECRIAFNPDDGSWSYVGAYNLSIPRSQPTMNLGWALSGISDSELRSVVQHEFGHLFGFIHEHQNPRGGIKWNKPQVIRDLSGPPNFWDLPTIQSNMFDTYSLDQVRGTAVDRSSIMMYALTASWTLDGFSTPWNDHISAGDRSFGRVCYP